VGGGKRSFPLMWGVVWMPTRQNGWRTRKRKEGGISVGGGVFFSLVKVQHEFGKAKGLTKGHLKVSRVDGH